MSSCVVWSVSTRSPCLVACPISRAERLTASPISVYSRRAPSVASAGWQPTTPQKACPDETPMLHEHCAGDDASSAASAPSAPSAPSAASAPTAPSASTDVALVSGSAGVSGSAPAFVVDGALDGVESRSDGLTSPPAACLASSSSSDRRRLRSSDGAPARCCPPPPRRFVAVAAAVGGSSSSRSALRCRSTSSARPTARMASSECGRGGSPRAQMISVPGWWMARRGENRHLGRPLSARPRPLGGI